MAHDDDGVRNLALAVLAGVIALVVALSIGIASTSLRKHTAAPPTLAATIYFAQGSDKLNVHASDMLKRIRESARARPGSVVRIFSIAPLRDEAQIDSRLAYLRARAVRRGLEGLGLAPDRMAIQPPLAADSDSDERGARRVELRLE